MNADLQRTRSREARAPNSKTLEDMEVYPPHRGFWLSRQLPPTTKSVLDASALYCAFDLKLDHGCIVAIFGHRDVQIAIGQLRTTKPYRAKFLEIMTVEGKLLRRVPRHLVCRVSHSEHDV